MWIDRTGSNLTSATVSERINNATGASYTAESLEAAYRVGSAYHNGGIYFQRVA